MVVRFAQDDNGGTGLAGARVPAVRRTGGGFGAAGREAAGSVAGGGLADGGCGEGAGLPEEEELFEAVEEAGEEGGDQGVQGGGRDSPISPRRGCGARLGAEVG